MIAVHPLLIVLLLHIVICNIFDLIGFKFTVSMLRNNSIILASDIRWMAVPTIYLLNN